MKIGIENSFAQTQSQYRGIGSYAQTLVTSLKTYDREDSYLLVGKKLISVDSLDILWLPYFFPYHLSLPLFTKARLIVTIHDLIPLLYPEHFPAGLKAQMIWTLQNKLLRRASAIITDSNASQEHIEKICNLPKDRIFTVHPAIKNIFQNSDSS